MCPFFGEGAVKHAANGPQHINGANNQGTPTGEDSEFRKRLPGAEEDCDLAGKVGEARQTASREGGHHEGRSNKGKLAQQPAKPAQFQGSSLLVNITA